MVKPIFVLGSPRSGTTLIGNYLGSYPTVLNAVEYSAFFFTYYVAELEFLKVPSPLKNEYLASLKEHAAWFIERKALSLNAKFFVDSTPSNLLIIKELLKKYPEATVILCLRNYRGVIQSLERSYLAGYLWAGENFVERARLWTVFYSNVCDLPANTIAINYDHLCNNPAMTLEKFGRALSNIGFNTALLKKEVFAKSHATKTQDSRPTLAKIINNEVVFLKIPSYNENEWNVEQEESADKITRKTMQLISEKFPDFWR